MKYYKILAGGCMLLLLSGCIDNKYDLSDVDTTSEFKVNDLVLPLNLDPVLLSDIIHVKEGEKLKEVTVNGKTFYAVEQSGEFNSDGITVNSFTAEPEPMEDKTAVFIPSTRHNSNKRNAGSEEFYFLMDPVKVDVEYKASDVDGSIRSLSFVNFQPFEFRIELSTTTFDGKNVESQLQDVKLEIPKGLNIISINAGDVAYQGEVINNLYDSSTGILSLENVNMDNNVATISFNANSIDLSQYKDTYKYDPQTNAGSFDMKSNFDILDCKLQLKGQSDDLAAVSEITYAVHYSLGEMDAKSILGEIEYNLEGTGLNIEPIELEDLPSFLKDPETDLVLANPQIYLSFQNPIGKYGLSYQSTLDIIAKRHDSPEQTFRSPMIKVPGETGNYNYLLAPYPENVIDIPSEFSTDIKRLVYNNLGNIIAGNGLPSALDISLIDPMIPQQTIASPFELNQTIEGMEGSYMFLAPLTLREGSKIVKTVDGWWSEDLAGLTINILKITAIASSQVPMEVLLTVYAVDKDGNRIQTSSEGSVKLPAMAVDVPIELTMEGTITDLDGVRLYVVSGSDNDTPLAPTQTITLDNLKAKVTGNYTRKL